MNERIKELAKLAAVDHQKTLPAKTHTTPLYLVDKLAESAKEAGIEIISDGFCEKFAELIIRECITQCNDGDSQYFIAKHFGIE